MDDRWPGSPPPPPEQPAGDWVVPAADPGPAFPPYLPPPMPRVAEPGHERAAEPVAEPGWAWRTNPAPPPEPAEEPERYAIDYGAQPDYPAYREQQQSDQRYGEQQYADPQYAEQQYGDPQYSGDEGYSERWDEGPAQAWRAAPSAGQQQRPGPVARGSRAAAGSVDPSASAGAPLDPPLPQPPPARPGLVATLCWTLAAFLLPVLLFLGWTATLDSTPRPGCVDVAGGPCPGPRAQAVSNLLSVVPALVVALAAALLLALGIRYIAVTWRSYKVAFAASVIGAGLTTLLVSALS